MKRSTLLGTVIACISIGFATPLLAAALVPMPQPGSTGTVSAAAPPGNDVADTTAAEKCIADLGAFNAQMQKDGYWLGGSGYGYGYPLGGAGYGYALMGGPATATGYQTARPGYEVRMLLGSANILARHGQQQSCEEVLATTRGIYETYAADMRRGDVRRVDVPAWQQRQIAAAQPVTATTTSFRSDELLGTDVRDPQNNALGSIDDLVMSPKTGEIAYLVIGRGGLFGIGEKYTPVPWDAFKVTPTASLFVLDTTKAVMDAAAQVSSDQFAASGHFDQESQKVDAYWKAHLSGKAASSG